jgi:cell division protein FtsW
MSRTTLPDLTEVSEKAPESKPDRQGLLSSGFDLGLVGIVVALAGYGLLMILSASYIEAEKVFHDSFHFVIRQLMGLSLGAVFSVILLVTPYGQLRRVAWPLYLVTLGLLVVVMTPIGKEANGATRWISLGPLNIQPSELARISLLLILADYLANNRGRLKDVLGVGVPAMGLVLPMLVLVIFQRDFGTTAILLGLAGVLLFVGGLQWRWVFCGAIAALSLLGFLVLVEPYRIQRFISFLDPFADPSDSGYQVVQGWIALATGGAFGTGLASGVAQRGFLPEPHNDFIGAVIGEELGAIGWVAAIVLEMGLVWRSFVIAGRATDLFGTLVATGIGAMFGAQAIINLGVVGGMLPAKGLVLPFLSYGASAAVVHATCIGLLLRIGLESARTLRQTSGGGS